MRILPKFTCVVLFAGAAPVSKAAECCGPEVTGPPPLSPYAGTTQRPCTAQEFHDKMKALNDDKDRHCDFFLRDEYANDVEWVPHKGKLHNIYVQPVLQQRVHGQLHRPGDVQPGLRDEGAMKKDPGEGFRINQTI
ncbi:hypothetical protein AAVH_08242 [Aphelenchoides avenae]|nr:hypothetical protein AAVH_08242 [Aphelenchus avenae]